MTPEQIGALLPVLTGSGGAIIVLYLWNHDLRRQRDYERTRVTELTDRYAASTTTGNEAIRDLTNAVLDAVELVQGTPTPVARRRRRSPCSG